MDAIDYARKRTVKEADDDAAFDSFDDEKACIACILYHLPGNDELREASEIVSPEDFCDQRLRIIYQTILQIDNGGQDVDLLNLTETLKRNQQYELAGGYDFLSRISDALPGTYSVVSAASRVADKARLRMTDDLMKTLRTSLRNPKGRKPDEQISYAYQMFSKLVDSFPISGGQGFRKAEDLMLSLMQDVREKQEAGKSGITGVPTGYSDLDAILSGLHKTDLIVIGARPGVGKTTLGMNIAANAALNPEVAKPVLFFSLEMPGSQIASRLLSSVGSVDQAMLRGCNPDDEGWIRMKTAWERFGRDNPGKLWINDDQDKSPAGIRSAIRRFIQKNGDISLIVVDYLQHMHIPGYPAASRPQEVAECSGALKAMAVEFDVPVIALAQLNRDVAKRGGKSSSAKPGLADLRDSGAIEQDADVVMFIHRNTDDQQNDRSAEIIVGKHRHGPLGKIKMQFQTEYCRYEQVCRMETPPEKPWYRKENSE